jgi:DUF971 family protein
VRLVQFVRQGPGEVMMVWDDGHQGPVSLRSLRDHCPCASCRGETVLLRTYVPQPVETSTPGRYDLKGAVSVGNYALQISWGDGHGEGIYTWELLRSLCECPACLALKGKEGSDA